MRADELATRAGVTVQLLRSYQSKGLVPPPRHEGRVAWYGRQHLDRLKHIRDLKDRGYSLRMIADTLREGDEGPPGPADERELLKLRDVAERSEVPTELIRALEASGLLRPVQVGREWLFTQADVRFVRHVLTLLGVGLPLDVFLEIARPFVESGEGLANDTVTAWNDLVASHLRGSRLAPEEVGKRVVTSAQALATIVGELVGYNVERAVLQAAQRRIESEGSPAERNALVEEFRPPRN
jgi:DNA-binding transcriptional MerR regulator